MGNATELLKAGKVNKATFFVDQNTSATIQVADYISQLFFNFGRQETNAAAAQYAGLEKGIFEVNVIMGECEYPFFYAWHRRGS
jgi:hypothetical protein